MIAILLWFVNKVQFLTPVYCFTSQDLTVLPGAMANNLVLPAYAIFYSQPAKVIDLHFMNNHTLRKKDTAAVTVTFVTKQ